MHRLFQVSDALVSSQPEGDGCAKMGELCFTAFACCGALTCYPPDIFINYFGVCGCPYYAQQQIFVCPPQDT